MNIVQYGESTCEKIRRYLDSYISDELLVETNHEVLKHLEKCSDCAAELETRLRIRRQLREAVRAQEAPAYLETRVRAKIRDAAARPGFFGGWTRWALAAAALVIIGLGGLAVRTRREPLPALADRPAQDRFIQRVSATISAVLQVGLKDHVHCAVFRQYPANPPSLEKMTKDLGPAYQALVPVVERAVPPDFRVVMAHQCGYKGRRYVHLTLKNGPRLVSLVITRKETGETMQGLTPAIRASGVAVYESAAERWQVAGFETRDFLAYVISDLGARQNLQLAANLAAGVHEFLSEPRG